MLILVPTSLESRLLFPELAPDAKCAPVSWLPRTSLGEPAWVGTCGFGLAAAGARAGIAWSRTPGAACLVGLAGSLDEARAPVGSLVVASSVEVEGIGFGSEETFVHPRDAGGAMADEWMRQAPATPWVPPLGALAAPILSVASSSGSPEDAARRLARHPGCVAEEMEAEAVLHAASALGRRLVILRGISNVAGCRDARAWRSAEALDAVRQALQSWLSP